MNLFRSEEHLDAWPASRAPGATVPVTTLGALAHVWSGDRLSPDWRPHTLKQNQGILEQFGLTGSFWRLA